MLPTAVPSSRAAGAARGAVGKLQFAYVVIFFLLHLCQIFTTEDSSNNKERMMSAFISSEFGLEGLGVPFTCKTCILPHLHLAEFIVPPSPGDQGVGEGK